MAGSLDALFEPLRIGNLRTRNRIVSLPHGNSYGRDGEPLPELLPYLQELAAQTAGIVTVGATAIDETTFREPLIRVFDERKLPVFREVAARIHAGGALAICQLGHSGWQAPIWQPGVPPWAPSPEPPLGTGDRLARLEVADLDRVREAYVRSARNALAAGFDGVEVHSAHGYLMQQFLSPHFNRRADAYGGSLENRARLLVEVLSLLRAEAGERLVGIRLGAGDDMAGGLELAEVLEVARMLDARRLVDYVSLSAPAKAHQYVKDESYPRGGLRESAGALKTAISIPVTVSQRIDTPELAAEILAAGQADLIGLARELVADPAWGAKARLGQTGDIRPCVACLEDCRVGRRQTLVGCSVNPTAYGLVPPLVDAGPPVAARRVVVVGGGPAGCEAALAAASRDCEVVLFERSTTLGGNARLAGQAPYRAAWARYADFLMRQVQQEPRIEVRLGQAADAVAVLEARPDLVVLATGATMSSSLAWADVPSLTSYDLLARAAPPDWRRVAVVDLYGRWDAVNAVELLVGAGVQVLYVTPQERIAHRVPEESRDYVLARLVAADVVCGTGARLSTEGRTAVVEGPFLRRQAAMEALDGIVVSGELAPETASRAWDLGGVSVRRVGDCLAPRGLSLATREGWLVGSILAAPVAA